METTKGKFRRFYKIVRQNRGVNCANACFDADKALMAKAWKCWNERKLGKV